MAELMRYFFFKKSMMEELQSWMKHSHKCGLTLIFSVKIFNRDKSFLADVFVLSHFRVLIFDLLC